MHEGLGMRHGGMVHEGLGMRHGGMGHEGLGMRHGGMRDWEWSTRHRARCAFHLVPRLTYYLLLQVESGDEARNEIGHGAGSMEYGV